jgi:primase-polymerase (primpol)-like protein
MSTIRVSNKSNILPILKNSSQWVCWAYDANDDFVPLDIGDYNPITNRYSPSSYRDPSIRMSYKKAKNSANDTDLINGVGYVVINTNFSYIDIDNCVEPSSGAIDPEVLELVKKIDSYTELSISGTGVHVYCKGDSPSYGWTPDDNEYDISVFDGSWAVVTEDHLEGFPASVQSKPMELSRICDEYDIDTHGDLKWN